MDNKGYEILAMIKSCSDRMKKEHDKSLEKVFKQLAEKNLTLNKDKCEFKKSMEF